MGNTQKLGKLVNGLTVLDSGYVGIGTNSPTTNLDVRSEATGFCAIFRNNATNGNGLAIFNTAGESRLYATYAGTGIDCNMSFWTTTSAGVQAEKMSIGITGNADIRIGGNYSNHAAANRGTLNINGTSTAMLSFSTAATTNKGFIYHNGNYMEMFNVDNSYLAFGTNNSERMRILAAGYVGIGITSPTSPLDVYGTTGYPSSWRYVITATSPDYPTIRLLATGSGKVSSIGNNNDGGMYFFVNGDATTTLGTGAMTITSAGSVGIGTTAPASPLDVVVSRASGGQVVALTLKDNVTGAQADGGYKAIRASSNSGGSRSEIRFIEEGGTNNDTAIAFATQLNASSLVEKMRISRSGYVTTPYNPAFRAYYSVNSDWILGGAATFVFNTTEYNIGSGYNTSNGRFTAPVTGVYQFNFYSIYYGAVNSGFVQLQKNGATLPSGTNIHFTSGVAGQWTNVHFVTSVYLNSGDYVAFLNAGAQVQYHGRDWSSLSGYFIG